jgi:hypothetical protein
VDANVADFDRDPGATTTPGLFATNSPTIITSAET